jgi:hypothetical protein
MITPIAITASDATATAGRRLPVAKRTTASLAMTTAMTRSATQPSQVKSERLASGRRAEMVTVEGTEEISTLVVLVSAGAGLVGALAGAALGFLGTTLTVRTNRDLLELQLAHDREMREIEELRGVFDAAAAALGWAHERASSAHLRRAYSDERASDRAREEVLASLQTTSSLEGEHQKLRLRVGSDHEIPQTYRAAYGHLSQANSRLISYWNEPTSEDLDEANRLIGTARKELTEFIDRCRVVVGTSAAVPDVSLFEPQPGRP